MVFLGRKWPTSLSFVRRDRCMLKCVNIERCYLLIPCLKSHQVCHRPIGTVLPNDKNEFLLSDLLNTRLFWKSNVYFCKSWYLSYSNKFVNWYKAIYSFAYRGLIYLHPLSEHSLRIHYYIEWVSFSKRSERILSKVITLDNKTASLYSTK